MMSAIENVFDFASEKGGFDNEIESARAELAQLRVRIAELEAANAALENDIVCRWCGTHYQADAEPPDHWRICDKSPIADMARQLEQARLLIEAGSRTGADGLFEYRRECAAWLAANPPAPRACPACGTLETEPTHDQTCPLNTPAETTEA